MFVGEALRAKVAKGQITLRYAFSPTSDGIPTRLIDNPSVDVADAANPATKAFEAAFFGDRVGISMGPVVYSHRYPTRSGRQQFKHRAFCFDLRETGAIDIAPGESLTISSIEQISLDGSTAATILPRLSLATAGVVVSATYIDPYWDGILQLHVINQASAPVTIRFGERIAICRFYPVIGGPVPAQQQKDFPRKSHHYGLNWAKILDTDYDPQPLRKTPTHKVSTMDTAKAKLGTITTWLRENFGVVAGVLIITAVVQWLRIEDRLKQVDETRADLKRIEETTTKTNDAAKTATSKTAIIGTTDIQIPPLQADAEIDVKIRKPAALAKDSIAFAETSTEPVRIEHHIAPDPASENTVLHLRAIRQGTSADKPARVRIAWIVGPIE